MKGAAPSDNSTQSALGILGTLVVLGFVLSAPLWMGPEKAGRSVAKASVVGSSSAADSVEPESSSTQNFVASGPHAGEQPYLQFCASCHGLPGAERVAGLTGSDLFDGVSERPMTRESILLTLEQGILEKGMLPMQSVLSRQQLEELTEYLIDKQSNQNT